MDEMKANISIYADHVRNKISRNLFGHFMEHCADVIYGSVYDPESALADEDGFRKDVLETLREAGTPMLRYPGGNFVSNYHWEDGIGPAEKRPKKFDYAWLAEDDNRFGTVEFIKLCRKVGAEPYICVNMGSGTAEEAMHWVEFCNGTGDTRYVRMRKELGYEEPFAVKYWGLGNEMYGDWQYGKSSAEDYAKRAMDFAKAMKWCDPSIQLIACGYDIGSDWNYTVAKELKQLIDHVAIHHYSIGYDIFKEEDYGECMYIPDYLTKLTKVAMADIVAGTDDALTDIKVAWDEWNTHAWDLEKKDDDPEYTLRNALLTAMILHSFIKNSDVVEIASYSPFVNVCGAISVKKDSVLKRTQYYVFKLLAESFAACDEYVESHTQCETYELTEVVDRSNKLPEAKFALNAKAGKRLVKTPYIDCTAALDSERKLLVLSVINKHPEKACTLDVSVYGQTPDFAAACCRYLYHEDFEAANTTEEPELVTILECSAAEGTEQAGEITHPVIMDGRICVPKHSLCVVEIPLK